jgi:hypothetical protein
MKIGMFGPGDDYAGRPGPQGDDESRLFAIFEIVAAAIVIAVLLLSGPASHAAPQASDPIVGPGPCHSDTPWGCSERRQYLPLLIYDIDVMVGDDATPEPQIVTPTPTATATATATVTPIPPPAITLIIVPQEAH